MLFYSFGEDGVGGYSVWVLRFVKVVRKVWCIYLGFGEDFGVYFFLFSV